MLAASMREGFRGPGTYHYIFRVFSESGIPFCTLFEVISVPKWYNLYRTSAT